MTDDLGSQEYQKYRKAEEVNATYSIKGEFTYFQGDGYTWDVDPLISV